MHPIRHILQLILVMALLVSCSDSKTALQQPNSLPEGFLIDEISLAMLPSGLRIADDSSASVLAWNKVRYERGEDPALEVWNCLVWQKCKASDESARWVLKTLFRHPQHESVWTWQSPSHSSQEGLRIYSSPPTIQDAYDFLHAARWELGPKLPGRNESDPSQILGADLRLEEWRLRFRSLPSVPIPVENSAALEERESRAYSGF